MITANTTSIFPTHFLRGVELIDRASIRYGVPSENWPAPTQYCYGMPMDHYYSEIWSNGMDYQVSYWIIEELDLEKPQIQPFIIFDNHEELEKFNPHDFSMLVMASFYYRRDYTFIGHKDLGIYNDCVWSYLNLFKNEIKYDKMKMFAFEHNSQEPVTFWMNTTFIPEIVLNSRKDKNVSNEINGGGNVINFASSNDS